MEFSIDLLVKSSDSFDLELVEKIKGSGLIASREDSSLGYHLVILDLVQYYDLALEMLKNSDNRSIFIFLCNRMLLKYKALYSYDRVDIEQRLGSIDNIALRVEAFVKGITSSNSDLKSMLELLLYDNDIALGNNENHNLKVSLLTKELLKRASLKKNLNISNDDIKYISEAAIFHDLGKVYIPKNILVKPSRLTNSEYDIIKSHTTLGANMIKGRLDIKNDRLAKYSYEISRWHHERYDGSGYPDHLKGDEIPLSAQAVGLADAFDALISKRAYKESYSINEALLMIKNKECGVFNPLLVTTLEEILS